MFLFLRLPSLRRGTFFISQFSASWSLYPLKRQLFSEYSARNFFIPIAILLIIPGPLFCPNCLSPVMVSIITSWNWRFLSSETLSSTLFFLIFSYPDVMMTPGFDRKVQKSFAAYLYSQLTLSLPNRMMG